MPVATVIAGLKGLAGALSVGVFVGATSYTQTSNFKTSLVVGIAAAAGVVMREVLPAGFTAKAQAVK